MSGGIDIPQFLNLIKADVMGWINSGIANAKISGVVINYVPSPTTPDDITLPNNLAYTNVPNSFIARQIISATDTGIDATYQGLKVDYSANPSANSSGIAIGAWHTATVAYGNIKNQSSLWGSASYAFHYGTGTVVTLAGLVALAEVSFGGTATTTEAVSAQVKNTGAGTITTGYGLLVQSPVNSGGGTFGTGIGVSISNQGLAGMGLAYGLNIAAQSGATNNYAIYTAGGDIYLIDTSTATSGSPQAVTEVFTVTPSGASSATFQAGNFAVNSAGSQNITGYVAGLIGTGGHGGSGTLTTAYGVRASTTNSSTGTVTNAIALRSAVGISNAGATTTNAYGIYADAVSYSAGTLTSIAQIAIVAPGAGTNRTNLLIGTATIPSGTYSIYNASTDLNYFAGVVQLEAANTLKQVATPANPSAGYNKLYFKAGDHLYMLNSAGTETQVDGGGGTNALLDGSVHTDTVAQTVSRGSIIYGNSTPKWDELTIGGAGKFLFSDGTDAGWASVKHIAVLSPLGNEPPSASYATFDTRNGHPTLDFDGAADEEAVWTLALPAWYAGGGLSVDVFCSFTSASTGSVRWQGAIERMDVSSLDIDADSFTAFQSVGGSAPSTIGMLIKCTLAFTSGSNMDSAAAGEMIRVKIRRDADGTSGTDDIATDAELLTVVVRET